MIPEQHARQAITLAGQGANVSEIARRLRHDRKTIRIYLNGHLAPGQPRPHADSFAPVRAALACRRCTSRTRQRHPVPVHLPAHQRACARHRTWLGRVIQIDLTAAPDIIRACQHTARLARQHGVTRLVLAEATTRQQTAAPAGSPHARQRAAMLTSSSPGLDPEHPDMAEAAAYPETIKMAAAVLSDPGALPTGPK